MFVINPWISVPFCNDSILLRANRWYRDLQPLNVKSIVYVYLSDKNQNS